MNGAISGSSQIFRSPSKRCLLSCRQTFCCSALLAIFTVGAFGQNQTPVALRAAARALTVGELSGVAERAEAGDSHSQLLLGLSLRLIAEHLSYNDKEGQAGMYRAALHWLRKAASSGSAPAEYFLARTDMEVVSTQTPNLANADDVSGLLRKAISKDYAPAMTALGRCYMGYLACGHKMNYALGLQWLKKAYSARDPEAACRIAETYELGGRRDQRDEGKADQWYLKGAEMADASSQNALGVNLAAGIGTQKNVKEAEEWFRKSAEQGDELGTCNLALDYMRGEGVAKDLVLSLKWVLISDQVNGGQIAGGNLCGNEIDVRPFLKLTPAQEAEATRQANSWLKDHNYPLAEPPKKKCKECNPLTGDINLVR